MRTGLLWALLVVLCQFTLVSSHVLGRSSYSTSDLDQLKSILQRIEETLAETGQQQEENVEAAQPDYEETNPEPERGQEGGQRPSLSDKLQSSVEGHSRTPSQISRLQDLLLAARSRSSSCFGARMDRIGNASGLGCNTGRG